MKTWSEAFTEYLASQGLSQQDAMRSLRRSRARVSQSQVSYWVRGARPREPMRKRIERWSKGEVASGLPAKGEDPAALAQAS